MTETPPEMIMITAIIQPFKLDVVMLALESIPGFNGMTVSECRGFGHWKLSLEETSSHIAGLGASGTELHRREGERAAGSDLTDFTEKVKLEIVVAERERAETIVQTISRAARTGRAGDGKIFMWPITHVVRIRTLELDMAALS